MPQMASPLGYVTTPQSPSGAQTWAQHMCWPLSQEFPGEESGDTKPSKDRTVHNEDNESVDTVVAEDMSNKMYSSVHLHDSSDYQ